MVVPITSQVLERLVNDLKTVHADNLASVTVYGSSARDDSKPDDSHDVLIILRRVELNDLRAALGVIRNWTSSGHPMPVYFSLDELRSAADVFPIEFLQMEQARKVIYGLDPFELVEISPANLRHQTEYELRTKCLQLRRLYFSAAKTPARLAQLMQDSLSSFAALFRAVLILHDASPPVSKREAIQSTARLLALDTSPFDRIVELRDTKNIKLESDEADNLFGDYLAQIQRVIEAVDRIQRD